jgi:hypothetical protein
MAQAAAVSRLVSVHSGKYRPQTQFAYRTVTNDAFEAMTEGIVHQLFANPSSEQMDDDL